jgi:hypothetical protein
MTVELNDFELNYLREKMLHAAMEISEASNGAYVTEGMFFYSKGAAKENFDAALVPLVEAANISHDIAIGLAQYLATIVARFEEIDEELATRIAAYSWNAVPQGNP